MHTIIWTLNDPAVVAAKSGVLKGERRGRSLVSTAVVLERRPPTQCGSCDGENTVANAAVPEVVRSHRWRSRAGDGNTSNARDTFCTTAVGSVATVPSPQDEMRPQRKDDGASRI